MDALSDEKQALIGYNGQNDRDWPADMASGKETKSLNGRDLVTAILLGLLNHSGFLQA